jgi:hypothetical protein
MATIGVSTERGFVHAVLLGGKGAIPPGRVLLQHSEQLDGDATTNLAAAVESALDGIKAELAGQHDTVYDIEGAAVAYRDPLERRAIVSRLASGQWRSSSLVSAKSAHLAAVRAMPDLEDFPNLLVYEAVPGFQTFSAIDATRSRVLGSDSIVAEGVSPEALGLGIRKAWQLLDAVAMTPDAVVLVGSLADGPGVAHLLRVWFDAPVVRGPDAGATTAVGAALLAMDDTVQAPVVVPAAVAGSSRRRYVLAGAALVAAVGLGVGAVIRTDALTQNNDSTEPTPVAAQPGVAAAAPIPTSANGVPAAAIPTVPVQAPVVAPAPVASQVDAQTEAPWTPEQTVAHRPPPAAPAALTPEIPVPPAAAAAPPPAPETHTTVPDPTGLLFPGEGMPPAAGTPEASQWWDNHWKMKQEWINEKLGGH